jgi:hypothetical protein
MLNHASNMTYRPQFGYENPPVDIAAPITHPLDLAIYKPALPNQLCRQITSPIVGHYALYNLSHYGVQYPNFTSSCTLENAQLRTHDKPDTPTFTCRLRLPTAETIIVVERTTNRVLVVPRSWLH